MLRLESLVRKLLPKLCKNKTLSIVCLATSNPVFLIFFDDSKIPELVVRISESESIRQAHQTTEKLYKLLVDLIPEPLILVKEEGKNIAIQKGVKGDPWFRLADKFKYPTQREKIRTRAIKSLNRLHHEVSLSPGWVSSIKPGNELRRTYKHCIDSGTNLPAGIDKMVTYLSENLDKLGGIISFPQHGDFCLNNLIIDEKEIHIIDFEDFGKTSMPFHDNFTLALSLYQLTPQPTNNALSGEIYTCINDTPLQTTFKSSDLQGFFLNHLLFRLGEWSQNRIEYRQWLLSILVSFNESPDSIFDR